VRVSPDGSLVAVVSNSEEASVLQLIPYRAGKFGAVTSVPLAAHGIAGSGHGPRGGVTASFADWHPSGRYLAVNVYTQNRVVFFELQQDGAGLDVRRWGNIVETGKDPFVGRFTPDGAYYLTADWGRDFTATTLEGRLPPRRSSISVIRLGEGPDPEHRRLGGVETDESSEGLAVSPDGRLVATVNMRTTAFSPDSARFAREATVTLLTFDPARGALEKVADYPFTGVLPEGAFDLSGNTLLVTVFQEHGGKPAGGGIDVWRVVKQEQPRLERAGRIVVPHGVHHVEVAR
jgi:DNA-binding beta-propeller fold protein YncE